MSMKTAPRRHWFSALIFYGMRRRGVTRSDAATGAPSPLGFSAMMSLTNLAGETGALS